MGSGLVVLLHSLGLDSALSWVGVLKPVVDGSDIG